jgi:hypothetical protein
MENVVCGTVGMFVGCSALSFCPRQLYFRELDTGAVDDEYEVPGGEPEYRSPLRSWHERASVRQGERRMLTDDTSGQRLFFSPDLVPLARHPLVKELPETVFDGLLIQHLYRYLDFTTKLESLVVNRTILGIAHGSVAVGLPEEMRFDAYKIYCDEAYHALFSVDLARQVAARTGVSPRLPAEPFFLKRLRQIQEELPTTERPLAELLFVVVSETLISAYLADVPDSDDVEPAVRDTIRDHAADEGRHHAYFAAFLRFLWAQLDRRTRRRAALLAPRLIDTFLRPDFDAARLDLAGYGLARDSIEQILHEVYTDEVIREHVRSTARQTVRYLVALDVLDDPEAVAEFHRYGLLDSVTAEPLGRLSRSDG